MTASLDTPKVFISYSWKPFSDKQKTISLAERLTTDGVNVIIDEWDLSEGQDKYQFMEQMVNNPVVHRVLLICNKDYSEKANLKKGGVGIESLIISDEIYSKAEQKKFIPIIFERDANGEAFVPTFVKTRMYIDLSNDSIFEEEYEKLLRNIYDKPLSRRPPIGKIPTFLQNDEPIYLPTAHMVSTIKNALINDKKNTPIYIQDYLVTFVVSLSSFAIDDKELNQENFDDIILKKIEELKILRDDFINFLEVYLSNSLIIEEERLHNFFEKLLDFYVNSDGYGYGSSTFGNLKLDNFRFFYYELFLTFVTVLLQKERFNELAFVLQTPFIIERKETGDILQLTFSEFRQYVRSLNEFRNKKHRLNRVSVTADMIKQRATDKYSFNKMMETDVVLYYISLLFPNAAKFRGGYWFPETSCYQYNLKVLPKTVSERYFNKIKVLFGVNNKDELLAKAEEIKKSGNDAIHDYNYMVGGIKGGLRIEEMCTLK